MNLNKISKYFKNYDWILLIVTCLLTGVGLVAIYAVNLSVETSSFLTFKKQVIVSIVGLIIMVIVSFIDYRIFRNYANVIYIFGILLLIAVLLFGKDIRGTKGWIGFGGLNLQVVEFVKIFLIIFLAKYLYLWGRQITELKHLFKSLFFTLILIGLVLMQPDFGSAVTVFLIYCGLLLIIGMKKSHLIVAFLLMLVLMGASWQFVLKDYQKGRVLAFLNPEYDVQGSSYNLRQAIIAIGAGKVVGRGLGFGSQTQLKFLPESHTDFIFAVIAEELGFIGVSLILLLFTILLLRILAIASLARDNFALFLVLGVFIVFLSHIFINIGMNIGVVPVMGISLPFVSYGGSFLLACFIMIGIVQGVYRINVNIKIA